MKPARKRLWGAALSAVLMLAACGNEEEAVSASAPAAPRVETLTTELVSVPNEVELPGRARAFAEAEIRPQVTGIIKRLHGVVTTIDTIG